MRQVFIVILFFLIGYNVQSQDMMDLSVIKDGVTSKRVSSWAKDGSNKDNISNIPDGKTQVLFDEKGPGIIKHIWITIAKPPQQLSRNDIILRMYWDGNKFPSVEAPIGSFFGQGWEESYNYASLPLAATPVNGRGLVCYFAMPFEKGARIEIENQTGQQINAFYYFIDYEKVDKLPKNSGRFHAWYNKQVTKPADEKENEWSLLGEQDNNLSGKDNYVIADIKGKGQFVGVNYFINCPTPMWYGEGDDMIFIDGDTIPTLNGTGTEDYFNTSWCPKDLYAHPYFGYARVNNDLGWMGRTHVYRFNITDPIYFNKSLKFTIEHGHNNNLTLDLSSVAYWYETEAHPVPAIPDKKARKPMPAISVRDIHRWRDDFRKNRGYDTTLWGNEK